MTAAAILTRGIARRLNGRCVLRADRTVLAKDGDAHADCSTCHSRCGDAEDMGLAADGIRITQDANGLALAWACPACSVEVVERTTALSSHADAATVAVDPLCHRCRAAA